MIAIMNSPVERTRFLKFMAVGAFGAVIDFGIANMLSHFFNMPLVYAGTISSPARSSATSSGTATGPIRSRSRRLAHQLGMFFLVNLAGVAIRIPILHYIEPVLLDALKSSMPHGAITPEFVARNLTLALAVGIVMLWNFFINRYWTYNDVE